MAVPFRFLFISYARKELQNSNFAKCNAILMSISINYVPISLRWNFHRTFTVRMQSLWRKFFPFNFSWNRNRIFDKKTTLVNRRQYLHSVKNKKTTNEKLRKNRIAIYSADNVSAFKVKLKRRRTVTCIHTIRAIKNHYQNTRASTSTIRTATVNNEIIKNTHTHTRTPAHTTSWCGKKIHY